MQIFSFHRFCNPYENGNMLVELARTVVSISALISMVAFLLIAIVSKVFGFPSLGAAILADYIALTLYFVAFICCNLIWILPRRPAQRSLLWCNLAPITFLLLPVFL